MEQLPASDAIFLSMETDEAPGHVGGLTIMDISDAPDFSYEKLIEIMGERIHLEPRYTQKLVPVAFGLDRPYMTEDPDFDIRNHIDRVAVPAPGDLRELADLCAYLFERPLHRDRPLWQTWLIEGLPDGKVAMFAKHHHCLMDGMKAGGIAELMCDLEPHPKKRPTVRARRKTRTHKPSDLAIRLGAARTVLGTPGAIVDVVGKMGRQMLNTMRVGWEGGKRPPMPGEIPKLRFNGEIGPRRGFACTSVPLADVKRIKKHFDVTINDVVLAITGSALRSYLIELDELPEQECVAMIAISTREEGDSEGNKVTSVPLGWATDIDDPVERLLQIHDNANQVKDLVKAFDPDLLTGMGKLPPVLTSALVRLMGSNIEGFMPGNAVVSNVRGTPVPLYTAGAKIESMYPMSVLQQSQGLNVTVVSYMDRVDVGFTVDPTLVPDHWHLAEAIQPAIDELLAVVDAESEAEAEPAPPKPRKKKAQGAEAAAPERDASAA